MMEFTMSKSFKYVFVVLSLFLSACPEDASDFELGKEFFLGYLDEAYVEPDLLRIAFIEVVTDSRCAEDVVCVWEGEVIVKLRMDGQKTLEFKLNSDSSVKVYNNFRITLVAVVPYPNTTKNYTLEDYVATLLVEEA